MDPVEIKKQLDDGFASVKTLVEKQTVDVKSEVKSLSDRLEKIEKSPIIAAPNLNLKFEKSYKGYNLDEQGGKLIERAANSKHASSFQTFRSEEKMYGFKRWMIDVVRAMTGDVKTGMELKAAMSEGTASQGGYLVPIEYQWDLVQLARDVSFILNAATMYNMSSNVLKLPAEASLVSMNWIAEAGAITASDPTFGQVTLTANKLAGLTTAMSNEVLADSALDIVSMLAEQFSYATGLELDNQALNGTGSPVSGVLTAAAGYSVVLGSGSTAFSAITFDVIRSAIRKLAIADAAQASFVYSKDVAFYTEILKDNYGRYLYRDPAGNLPPQLWNKTIFQSAKAPQEADSGTGKGFIALGDWSKFYIGRRRGDMTIDVDPYGSFANDGVRFRMVTRWALALARSTAFCRIVTA